MLTLIVGLTLVALLGYSAFVVIVIARAERGMVKVPPGLCP